MFSKRTTYSKSYYYSTEKLFEKSLDVYKPLVSNEKQASEIALSTSDDDLPVVLLVVGSGWVGHRAFAYMQTSWWNASGPKTIASLGCTCVCIRHRGAFCVLPKATAIAEFLFLLLAVLGAVTKGQWHIAVGVTAFVALVVVLLALGGRGSATMEDMWDDVAEALEWIEHNQDKLRIQHDDAAACAAVAAAKSKTKTTTTNNTGMIPTPSALSLTETTVSSASVSVVSRCESMPLSDSSTSEPSDSDSEGESTTTTNSNNNPSSRRAPDSRNTNKHKPVVFGGYSSGGHVASTLLQQPHVFSKHNLPAPEDLFDGILLISGMMAIRPGKVTLQDKSNDDKITVIGTPQGAPRWLTDFVVYTVWGPQKAEQIPSPLTDGNPPNLPHLLVGCRNEMFGLPWLDIFFCSRAFAELVRAQTGKYAKYVEVESDHWNILNSKALRDALGTELPKLVAAGKETK